MPIDPSVFAHNSKKMINHFLKLSLHQHDDLLCQLKISRSHRENKLHIKVKYL